jgi:hypothetical protein
MPQWSSLAMAAAKAEDVTKDIIMSTRENLKIIPLNAPERLAVKAQETLCKTCRFFDCDCGEEVQVTATIERYLTVTKCSGYRRETVEF